MRKYAKKYWLASPDAHKVKGGHGDLVSSGGIKDIIYWKSIPDNKRLAVYHGYIPPTISDPNDPSKDTPVPYEKDPEPEKAPITLEKQTNDG